jgi:5-methylcytosine-specific restriction endonuclease McrA
VLTERQSASAGLSGIIGSSRAVSRFNVSGNEKAGMMPRNSGEHFYKTREWRLLRKEVLTRDSWECQIRGRMCAGIADRVDHVLPRSKGGSNSLENLVAACCRCNSSKKDSLTAPIVTVNW